MNKILCILFLSFFGTDGFSQENEGFYLPVNMDYITTEISNPNSSYYYPKLMKRFNAFDSTLTVLDYRFLYYGFSEQPKYNPNGTNTDESEIMILLNSNDEPNPLVLTKAETLLKKNLAENPFNLKLLHSLIYVSDLLNNNEFKNELILRYSHILDAVISSGDGLSCETGFKVLSISDEYIVMNAFGLDIKGQSLVDGPCDLLYLDNSNKEYAVEGIYFSIDLFFGK